MKTFSTILLILIFTNLTFSQSLAKEDISIKGKILEQESNHPLSYVSVGISNKSFGTLTDTLGNFNFTVSQENMSDTLQISLVGYFSKKIMVKDFVESSDKTIKLIIKIMELPELVVTKSKTNYETLGRQGSGKLMQVSIHNKKSVNETIGSEMGMRYKTKQVNAILKDFNFNISGNNFNTVKYRINIYSVKDDMPDTLIYNRQIFLSIDNFKTGWIKIDLEPYHIEVPAEFIVTVQWVDSRMDKKENPVTMIPVSMSPFSKNCYVRIASQDKWKKMGMNLSNYVTLEY